MPLFADQAAVADSRLPLQGEAELQVLAALHSELDTHWLPDPWQWSDLPTRAWREEDLTAGIGHLVVPLIAKENRRVPILDEASQLALLRATVPWIASRDAQLGEGVLAYRFSPSEGIEHYRRALAGRVEVEGRHHQLASFVAHADIEAFFPSARLELFAAAAELGPGEHALWEVLIDLQRHLGYVLPEGYVAARALANFFLRRVDSSLVPWPFTRWVDDYRVFTPSVTEARVAVDAVHRAVESIGLRVAHDKTRVTPALPAVDDVVSVVDHIPGQLDSGATPIPERLLRHELRLICDIGDTSRLAVLVPDARGLSGTAVPRLAAVIGRWPTAPNSRQLVTDLLAVDDELAAWRCGRLAYALWFWPTGSVSDLVPRLVDRYHQAPAIRPIVLRCLARHSPEVARSLVEQGSGTSGRCEQLIDQELSHGSSDGSGLMPPPLISFL